MKIHQTKVHRIPPIRPAAVSRVETWSTESINRAVEITPPEQHPKRFCILLLRGCQTRFFDELDQVKAEAEQLLKEMKPFMAFKYSAKPHRYFLCHYRPESLWEDANDSSKLTEGKSVFPSVSD